MITARMRCGVSWHDICILDVSTRGLGIQAPSPPPRGTYVEICRGTQAIIACVMWTKGHRAGLKAQEPIWIQALLGEPSATADPQPVAVGAFVERRRVPRTAQQTHDSSRLAGRAMEFAFVAMAVAGMGAIAFGIVEQAFAGPMSQIDAALNQGDG